MITFTRRSLLLSTIGLFVLVHFVRPMTEYFFYSVTEGIISEVVTVESHYRERNWRPSNHYPESYHPHAEFVVDNKLYRFVGPTYYDYQTCPLAGDRVKIIYNPNNPSDAQFYNLSGFWFKGYLWKIMLLIACIVFIVSWIKKDQKVMLRFRPKLNEKMVETTPSAEDAKMKKIRNWALHNQMFGKRRR
ncbi:MAG: DUF3592 domain-containing protein [Crocinitomicaceae bacterium]|nr:DUF3592 domain-containing protein [Crocinitomicaceae bacterium]